MAILLAIFLSAIDAAAIKSETSYGKGLPRDLDSLAVPDSAYPDWPLQPHQQRYAAVSGERMKRWVEQISDIAYSMQQEGITAGDAISKKLF